MAMKGWIGVMEEEDLEDKVKEEQIIDIEDHKKHQKKLEYRREYTKRCFSFQPRRFINSNYYEDNKMKLLFYIFNY